MQLQETEITALAEAPEQILIPAVQEPIDPMVPYLPQEVMEPTIEVAHPQEEILQDITQVGAPEVTNLPVGQCQEPATIPVQQEAPEALAPIEVAEAVQEVQEVTEVVVTVPEALVVLEVVAVAQEAQEVLEVQEAVPEALVVPADLQVHPEAEGAVDHNNPNPSFII